MAVGINVLAYATNREVQDKLARPRVSVRDPSLVPTRDTIVMPKLKHGGGDHDAPNAWANLVRLAAGQLQIRIRPEEPLATDDPRLLDYPIVFMHGRRKFRFTSSQRKALATYIERGGFILADSICASSEFSKSFRNEMKMIFPDAKLEPLSGDHPLLTDEFRGYDLKTVMLRRPQASTADAPLKARLTRAAPQLEGLVIDDRLAVVFSPVDISCALENHASLDCESYEKTDAARIGINVILYALQQ